MAPTSSPAQLRVYSLGRRDYLDTWRAMTAYTDNRTPESADQLWLVEHPPVYTQGQAGKTEHLLAPGEIPVVQSDRGGQVTYHGPGQLVAYALLDLRRLGLGVRALVTALEQSLVDLLALYGISARARPDAPGVYVGDAKIAALGLRVRRGCSFHGLSFNLAMDLEPFSRINPCGYRDLPVTQLADILPAVPPMVEVHRALIDQLVQKLGYETAIMCDDLPPGLPRQATHPDV